jgi:hypothetical protein
MHVSVQALQYTDPLQDSRNQIASSSCHIEHRRSMRVAQYATLLIHLLPQFLQFLPDPTACTKRQVLDLCNSQSKQQHGLQESVGRTCDKYKVSS